MGKLPEKAAELIQLPDHVSKCLIVKPSSLGDIIHSLPFLDALYSHFPGIKIHWVVASEFTGLLEGHSMIDRLWPIEKSQWKKLTKAPATIREFYGLAKGLRKERFELVVDLQGLLRSGIITGMTGAPMRVGLANAREGSTLFYTHKVKADIESHAVDRYLGVATALGLQTDQIKFPLPYEDYPLTFDEYAVIVPGARWDNKIWPAENFGTLASLLPMQSIIVGSSADSKRALTVEKHSMGKATNLVGRTSLKELAGIIRKARMMITNDSGPMHIAAAFGVPVYALFGPTSPGRTGPYGKGHTIIQSNEPCAPCFKRNCPNLLCMEGISPSDVLESIRQNEPSHSDII